MDPSLFKIISIGYVAGNKKLSSREIQVMPAELVPYLDGELTDATSTISHTGVDADGKKYSTKLEVGNTITATWLQWGSNRVTPPDVRRGERVLIWQYDQVDKFYWTTTGLDDVLRRLETVVWAFSATKDENTDKLTIDNCYTVEVSTHRKLITVTTSKANNEPFRYTFQINADKGGVVLSDDANNYLELNSGERRWTMKNGDGSILKIDKKTIYGFAAESIALKTKDYTLEASNSITETTKEATLTASSKITRSTATYAHSASAKMDFTTPQATFSAKVNILGLATLSGGLAATPGAGGATATFTVPISGTGPVAFSNGLAVTGTLTNNNVNVGSTHTHPETNAPGGSTLTPQ